MSTATIVIGPEHAGQQMSLDDFENAEVREGYLYELGRGVVVVNQVPNPSHFLQVEAIQTRLCEYKVRTSPPFFYIGGGSNCKILVRDLESERHPDLCIYMNPLPAGIKGSEVWAVWIPDLVIEVVSNGSGQRDYIEKPEEYLQFGVKEYWVVDAEQELLTVLQRSGGQWREHKIKPPTKHTTHLLAGFELDIEAVFAAAKDA